VIEVRQARPEEWSEVREIPAGRAAPDAFGSTRDRELAFGEHGWRGRIGNGPGFLARAGSGLIG
jgi:hypothetical protein